MEIVERVSMKDIRESGARIIYYAARTCWWTHDLAHLSLLPPAAEAEEGRVREFAENLRRQSGRVNAPIEDYLPMARSTLSHRLPSDPRGSVLFETDDVQGFLNKAAENPAHYGRHGLRAFMAAHHSNCQRGLEDARPWSAESWDEYNAALDRLDQRALAEKQNEQG